MGYGQNLNIHLQKLKINPRQLSQMTGVPSPTIYASINRDTPLRYDYAIRIFRVTGIPISAICKDIPTQPLEYTGNVLTDILLSLPADSSQNHPQNKDSEGFPYKSDLETLNLDPKDIENLLFSYAKLKGSGRNLLLSFVRILNELSNDSVRREALTRIQKKATKNLQSNIILK